MSSPVANSSDLAASPASDGSARLDREQWFVQEVQPHQLALRYWLRARFSRLLDVDNIVQESLVRVWRAVAARGVVENPRSYLYATAQNAALDQVRRQAVFHLDSLVEADAPTVMDDKPGIPDVLSSLQELELLHEAINRLPMRCRIIMTLRKIHGRSNREIARHLGISLHTVNAQIVIGLVRCREYLGKRGVFRGQPKASRERSA